MTYEKPEINVVGAAQNLVLGVDPKSTATHNFDDDLILYVDLPGFDPYGW